MKISNGKFWSLQFILCMAMLQGAIAFESPAYTVIEDKAKLPILTPGLSERKVLKIRLANGLEALIISDPKADKSAASLTVEVGSWDNPKDHPGLAHFLEHMLFLGTKKYPVESEYDHFINTHGGKFNAYTSSTQTSYMFSVDNAAFPESLDRFSSFFIEPLFNPSGVARELQAIDQEYARSLDNDDVRGNYVTKEIAVADHPFHQFQIGNSTTLSNTSQEVLKEWYRQHYSANLMHLVVTSPLPLEKLTELVVNDFKDVPNINAKAYNQEKPILSESNNGHMVYIEPVKDLRSLTILWELPFRFTKTLDNQPDLMLCSVLGHEGETSLLAELKREDLAEALQCGIEKVSQNNWIFQIEFQLTSKGVKNIDQVLERTFQAIAKLKESGVPQYIFDETKQLATINYQYKEREDAFDYVMGQTFTITQEPIETYPEQTQIIQKFDESEIRELLNVLVPKKAQYYLIAPSLITGVHPDRKEKWVGVEYTIKALNPDLLKKLEHASTHPKIDLPHPNPFIPKNLELVTGTKHDVADVLIPTPEVIVENERGLIYFSKDYRYNAPLVHLYFEIKTPQIDIGNAAKVVLADLYVKSVMDALTNFSFPASLAGLNYVVKRTEYGLSISIDGYNEHADLLLKEIVKQLKDVQPLEQSFVVYKDSLLRDYLNAAKQSPFTQAVDLLKRVLYQNYATDQQKAAAIEQITYDQFKQYISGVFAENYIQGLLYGNLSKEKAEELSEIVMKPLENSFYPQGKNKTPSVIVLPKKQGPFYIEENVQVQGNAAILAIENSSFTYKAQAAQNLLMLAMKGPFFASLRTKQQTGYLVTNFQTEVEKQLFDLFAVQSNTHDPRDLLARFEQFIEGYMQEIDHDLPEEAFNNLKQTLVNELEQPPNNIQEMGELLQKLAFKYDADFEWISKKIHALKELKYEEFLELSQEFVGRQNRQRIGLLIKGITPDDKNVRYTPLTNLDQLKNLSTYTDGL